MDDVSGLLEGRGDYGLSCVLVLDELDWRNALPDDVHDNLVVLLSPALAFAHRCRVGAAITLGAIEQLLGRASKDR